MSPPSTDQPTTVVVKFFAKPGSEAELRTMIGPAIPRLADLEGCRGGSLYYDIDEPQVFVLIEHWDSVAQHKAYIDRVEADGTMARMKPLLEKPPERRYLDSLE